MRLVHLSIGIACGVMFGVMLLLVGGITVNGSPTPRCPGCAVLTHPYGSCNEAVVGGYICP